MPPHSVKVTLANSHDPVWPNGKLRLVDDHETHPNSRDSGVPFDRRKRAIELLNQPGDCASALGIRGDCVSNADTPEHLGTKPNQC